MNLIREMLSYPFLVRALAGGIMVSLCASLLGVSLVLRRYSMIGDGLSHVSFGALSIALAMGLSTLEGTAALENFPPLAQALLSKPVVVAGVMSFLLNLLAPGKTVDEEARERAALDAE